MGRDGISFYYDIPSDIAVYGMLVLSSNNKAVENITLELPNISSIKEGTNGSTLFNPRSADQQVDLSCFAKDKNYEYVKSREVYFTFLADRLAESNEQWGLISARLGKKSNINTFMPVLDVYKRQAQDYSLLIYAKQASSGMKLTINSVEDFNYEGVALGNFGNIPQQYVDVALRDPKYVVGNYIFKEAYGTAFENMALHKK